MTIFLSHASVDGDAVRSLVRHLESAGSTVWLDQDLTGGEAWWSAILRQIRECEIFVFALSENALQSDACQLELTYARDLGLPILPVQIGDLRGLRDHAIFAYQAIDFRSPTASTGIALIRALHERQNDRQPLPNPLPAPPPPPYEYLMLLGTAINGRAPLSAHEQDSILLQLRQAWREERNENVRANVRTLLGALRERPEVTYRTVTEIDALLQPDEVAQPQPPQPQPQPQPQPRPQPQPQQQTPQGWYRDPAGLPVLRYWDGRQWTNQTRTDNPWSPEPLPKTSRVMSVVAFVLAAAALLIPFVGLAGIGFGIAAAVRKEKLGQAALWASVAATVLGFVVWGAINSG